MEQHDEYDLVPGSFAVQVEGSKVTIASLGVLLAQPGLRVRPIRDESAWLEISDPAAVLGVDGTAEVLREAAGYWLARVNQLIQVYRGTANVLAMRGCRWRMRDGGGRMESSPGTIRLVATLPDHLTGRLPDGWSGFSRLLDDATRDEWRRTLLELLGAGEITWSTIYSVLKFLNEDRLAAAGLLTKKASGRILRTANFYRHPGEGFTLPDSPPTLAEARGVVLPIVRAVMENPALLNEGAASAKASDA